MTRIRFILWSMGLVVTLILLGGLVYEYRQVIRLNQSFITLENSVNQLTTTASSTASSTPAPGRQQIVQQVAPKPAAQSLESAVAKATPAVVSIVESKEVPKLQVTYINPFGNDPFFQGFGMQVPVYQQVGTTTERVAAGTGFFVRTNGYIVTNKHVVPDENATYTALLSSGTQKNASVVWRSPTEDLAVLKIGGSGYATIPLGDSSKLQLGQSVFVVGNALGEYNNSVSVGVISGLNRSVTASDSQGNTETLTDIIQTDAAINPGNSGGPLVDLAGEAVGVNVAMVQGSQSIGFSLPISKVRNVLANLGI